MSFVRTFSFALAALLAPSAACAGTLSGALGGAGVVWVSDGSHPAPTSDGMLTQGAKKFIPPIAVISAGSTVRFRNDDSVDHSVYSVSPAGPFDLGIYEPGPGKDLVFAKPGVIDIRCHIHRRMRATLVVVDGPFAIVEPPRRAWTIAGVRPGRHVVHTWTERGGETRALVLVR